MKKVKAGKKKVKLQCDHLFYSFASFDKLMLCLYKSDLPYKTYFVFVRLRQ